MEPVLWKVVLGLVEDQECRDLALYLSINLSIGVTTHWYAFATYRDLYDQRKMDYTRPGMIPCGQALPHNLDSLSRCVGQNTRHRA